MPRKKKQLPKKKPRVKRQRDQLGHIVYVDSPRAKILSLNRLNLLGFTLPFIAVLLLAGLIFYVYRLNSKTLSFLNFPSQTQPQNVISQINLEVLQKPRAPTLKTEAVYPAFSARGIYAVNLQTGTVLFAKNEASPLLPASTTKMATALVALNTFKPEDILTVKTKTYGQTMGLVIGEQITFDNLLHGLLIYSANDAAETIASNYPGDGEALPAGRQGFIEAMNKFAEENNLSKTHFTNPVGFDEYLHFSTALDMAKLAQIGLQNETFAKIVSMEKFAATNINNSIIHNLTNTNQLLGKVEGVVGVKTGHTTTSGESLVTLVDRAGHKVLISMLGSQDRFGESTNLIEWIYNNYQWTDN